MQFIPKFSVRTTHVEVTQWGMIDDMILNPGDQLLLGEATDGDLLVVKPYGFGEIKLARLYNDHLLLEPHKRSVTKKCWTILGGVKGIEKSLQRAVLGQNRWYVRIYNLPVGLDFTWLAHLEEQALPAMYLSELGNRLHQIDSQISMVACLEKEHLDNCMEANPGMISFSPNRSDSEAKFVGKWALASRRKQRRAWEARMKKTVPLELFPIPSEHIEVDCGKLASK